MKCVSNPLAATIWPVSFLVTSPSNRSKFASCPVALLVFVVCNAFKMSCFVKLSMVSSEKFHISRKFCIIHPIGKVSTMLQNRNEFMSTLGFHGRFSLRVDRRNCFSIFVSCIIRILRFRLRRCWFSAKSAIFGIWKHTSFQPIDVPFSKWTLKFTTSLLICDSYG